MGAGLLVLSGCSVDLGRRRVLRDGEETDLTSREAELLEYLAANPGRDVPMDELHHNVWGHNPNVVSRAAFHTARRLRAKIERDPARPEHLIAVHSVGFRLVLPTGLVKPTSESPPTPPPLPAERDAFVGRQEALDQLDAAFAAGRLVTLTGFGGMGKTRLAAAYARRTALAQSWPGGVWFCALAAASDQDGVVSAVAAGLGAPLLADPVPQLGHALAARGRCLVVLDNFEQVAAFAEATVGRWLDLAPELRLLVTSRHLLGLPGERLVALQGLPPAEAVALLRDRAAAACPGSPGPDDAQDLQALAALLEGIPLSIELAAARLRVMSLAELRRRMGDQLGMLAVSSGRPDRQATLRGVLGWSWGLLAPFEQAALAQLSLFEGGFSLDAAEAVIDLAPFDEVPAPLDVVQSLCDRSLVQRGAAGRMSLLVPVRAFAAEQLDDEARAAAERRHGDRFADFADTAAQMPWDAVVAELDNLVAACRRAIDRGDGRVAAATALGAWVVFERRGPFGAASALLDRAAATASAEGVHTAKLLLAAGQARRVVGDHVGSLVWLEAALDLARRDNHRLAEADTLVLIGHCLSSLGRPGEIDHHRLALEVLQQIGDPAAIAHQALGTALLKTADRNTARAHLEAAHAGFLAAGDHRGIALSLRSLAADALRFGRVEDARGPLEEALAIYEQAGDQRGISLTVGELALVEERIGRLDHAEVHLERALAVDRTIGSHRTESVNRLVLGQVRHFQGRFVEAEEQLRRAGALASVEGGGNFALALGLLGILLLDVGRIDEAREHLLRAEGILVRHGLTIHAVTVRAMLGATRVVAGEEAEGYAALDDAARLLEDFDRQMNAAQIRCTLGQLQVVRGKRVEAKANLERALNERVSDVVRGAAEAALALVEPGLEDARRRLADGEVLLRKVGNPVELAKLLAMRAVLERERGAPEAARAALDEAIALATGVGPRSELARLLALAAAPTAPGAGA